MVQPATYLIDYIHPEIPCFVIDPSNLSDKLPLKFVHIKEAATTGVEKFSR